MTNALPDLLANVALCYERLSHRPNIPAVRVAYHALMTELWDQYLRVSQVIDFRFTDLDPYARYTDMFADIDRGVLYVYTHHDMPASHPLRECAPNGNSYNNIFRAVHDALAHYPERNDFTYRGEFNAFRAHCHILSPIAQLALTTETLGQNAWLHFGPLSHLPLASRPFADQKADILPVSLIRKALTIHV